MLREQFPDSAAEVVTADGREIMNTALPPDAPAPIRPNLDSVHEVFATGSPAVSNVYKSAIGDNAVVAIDVPVKSDTGTILYVLSLHPRLAGFADLIRRQRFPPSWIVWVVDRDGVVVTRFPEADALAGHPAPAAIVSALKKPRAKALSPPFRPTMSPCCQGSAAATGSAGRSQSASLVRS